jgi:hypothetical protein
MRPRSRSAPWLLATVMALAGCSSSTRLLVQHTASTTATHAAPAPAQSTTTAPSPNPRRYLAQLQAEERTLAAAERRIPRSAPTPQALSHSASLLADAVARLGRGLASITPPPTVAGAHARLVAVVQAYAGRLRSAAAIARRPNGQVQAGTLLISATNRASAAFGAALAKIYSTLGVRQP